MENFQIGTLNKFRECYNKCIKLFFSYKRCDQWCSGKYLFGGTPSLPFPFLPCLGAYEPVICMAVQGDPKYLHTYCTP